MEGCRQMNEFQNESSVKGKRAEVPRTFSLLDASASVSRFRSPNDEGLSLSSQFKSRRRNLSQKPPRIHLERIPPNRDTHMCVCPLKQTK